MKLPEGFDPLTVTRVHLNECYFHNDEGYDEACRLALEWFPNAEINTYILHEDPTTGVLMLSAEPPLSTETVLAVLEEFQKLVSPDDPSKPHLYFQDSEINPATIQSS